MKPSGPPWDVVHMVFSIAVGGQEMVVLALAEHMERSLFRPRVLCLEGAGELAPRFAASGIPVDVIESSGKGGLEILWALRRYLRQRRPAILHTHNPTPHQLGALSRLATPIPVLVHTKHGRNHSLSTRGAFVERFAGRLTDAVVAVSDDTAGVAREVDRVSPARIRVIRNGVNVNVVGTNGATSSVWRAVHVARLNRVKDQRTLIRAVGLVQQQHPGFALDIVGDGPRRADLESLTAELGLADAIHFHGYQADIQPYLDGRHVFLLSSVSEGIALTLLEAMAAGLPVVATDVGGNREVVVPGETGFLVPARDPAAMARAIVTLLREPARAAAYGAAGRRRAASDFSLAAMVSAYQGLYCELLSRRVRGLAA